MFFYQSSRGVWHANYKSYLLFISNPEAFGVRHGIAIATFELVEYNATLMAYDFISNPDETYMNINSLAEASKYNNCPLLGKSVVVAVYRVQHRNDKEGCASQTTVYRYLQYIDSHLRLLSANRIRMDLERSVISNVCCPCNEADCYGPNNYGTFMNTVTAPCRVLDPRLDTSVMTRLYINDGFGGFAGLASLGWIGSFTNYGNYWAINNVNNDPDEEWKWDYNLSVIVHEFGHTMGMNHASWSDYKNVGFLKTFTWPDNYGDGGSVLGGGGSWDTIIGPTHYFYRFADKNVEPFWFKTMSAGKRRKIRLFAWDHPYSRPFLGIEEARYQENDVLDGIPYQDNMLTIEIPWNYADMCSTVGEEVKYGSFFLEYRSKKGNQNGAANRGVRPIQGKLNRSGFNSALQLMLNAGVDDLGTWADSVIPAGMTWVPRDSDLGTVSVHITKINSVDNKILESMLDDSIQPLEKVPYMEVEVTYAPGIRYIPPLHPSPPPVYEFSPNLMCAVNEEGTEYSCSKVGSSHVYAYMKPFAQRGYPRVYPVEKGGNWGTAALAVVSLDGKNRLNFLHYYSDSARFVKVSIEHVKSEGGCSIWYDTTLSKKLTTESDDKYVIVNTKKDIAFLSGLNKKEGEEVFIMDLFGYKEKLDVSEGTFMYPLPKRSLNGFYEAFIIKEKDSIITWNQRIRQLVSMSSDTGRIAIHMTSSTTITLSSPFLPSRYTLPTMFHSQQVKSNTWLSVMMVDWTIGDSVFFDLSGVLPRNFYIEIEHDNGVYKLDLARIANTNDCSIRVKYIDLIKAGSFSAPIYHIRLSHTMTLLSIRMSLASNVGENMPSQGKKTDYYNIGTIRYKGEIGGFSKFLFTAHSAQFNSKIYEFASESVEYEIDKKIPPLTVFQWILIGIAVVLGIAFVVFVIGCFASCKKRKKQSAVQSTTKRTLQRTKESPLPSSPKPSLPSSPKPSLPPKPLPNPSSSSLKPSSPRSPRSPKSSPKLSPTPSSKASPKLSPVTSPKSPKSSPKASKSSKSSLSVPIPEIKESPSTNQPTRLIRPPKRIFKE